MPKEINLKVKLVHNQLDRAITYSSHIQRKTVFFTVCHNKMNAPIQFQVDPTSGLIRSNKVEVSMHRNLRNSKFCQAFLQLENIQEEKVDYQNKFSGLERSYERDIFQFLKEKHCFHLSENKKPTNNYLLVIGWKIHGFEDDLNFFFFQRRCYNNITRNNIIRTAGIQFATKKGLKALDNYYDDSQNSIRKIDRVPFLVEDSTSDIDDMFATN